MAVFSNSPAPSLQSNQLKPHDSSVLLVRPSKTLEGRRVDKYLSVKSPRGAPLTCAFGLCLVRVDSERGSRSGAVGVEEGERERGRDREVDVST